MGANASNGTKYLAGCPPIPPAPSDFDVQQQFQELLQSKHVTHSVIEALCTMESNETKWMYICLSKWLSSTDTDATKEWLDPRLATQEILDLQLQHECISELCRAVRINILLRSKTKMTGILDWTDQFVTEKGVEALLVPLDPAKKQLATPLVYTEVVHVLLTLSYGNRGVTAMAQPSFVLRLVTMAFAAVGPSVPLQGRLLQLLGMICCHNQPSQQNVVTALRSLSPDAKLTALATAFFEKLNEKGEESVGPLSLLTFINIVLNTTRTCTERTSLRHDLEQCAAGSLLKTIEEWKTAEKTGYPPEMDLQIQVYLKSYQNDLKTVEPRKSLRLDLDPVERPLVIELTSPSVTERRPSLSALPSLSIPASPSVIERRPSNTILPQLSIPTLSTPSEASIPIPTSDAPTAPSSDAPAAPSSSISNVLNSLQQLDQATQDKVLALLNTLTSTLTTQSEPQTVLERVENSLNLSSPVPSSNPSVIHEEEEEEHSPRRSMTETESYESSSSLYETSSTSVVKPTSMTNPKLALQGFFQHLKKGQALPSAPAPTPMATASVKKDAKRPVFAFATGSLPPSTPLKTSLILPALTPARPQVIPGTPIKPPLVRPSEASDTSTIPDLTPFRKLLSMGAPKAAVRMKMQQAGLNPDWLELEAPPQTVVAPSDPPPVLEATVPPPAPVAATESSSSIEDSVSKFRKLLSMGAPLAAVKAKMMQAGVDPSLLDQKPTGFASPKSSETAAETPAQPPVEAQPVKVRDHPDYIKFFKLQSMGAPIAAVKAKIMQAGLDPNLLDTPDALYPTNGSKQPESNPSEASKPSEPSKAPEPSAATAAVLVKDDPDYAKFFKLLSMGAPAPAVKAKMVQAGLKPELLDTPDAMLTSPAAVEKAVLVKDDPEYAKFFKLQTMGAPAAAVKAKMVQAGLNPDLLETPDAPLVKGATKTLEKPLMNKEDPRYANFFKLLSMGTPIEAVKAKMKMAGLDGEVLMSPDAISSSTVPNTSLPNPPPPNPRKAALALAIKPTAPKPTTRAFYWQQLKKNRIAGTIWEELDSNQTISLSELDLKPLEIDFPAPTAPLTGPGTARGRSFSMELPSPVSPRSSIVFLLDRSRANNISIIIKQFRMSPLAIREAIMKVDTNVLSLDRLQGLIKILPTDEEVSAIMGYRGELLVLNEAERILRELLTVPRLKQRLEAIQAMLMFPLVYQDIQQKLTKVRSAQLEIITNGEWKCVLSVVLQVGNKMNTGTSRGNAMGFQLGDLLKLAQLKASTDKSVTLLHHIARYVRSKLQTSLSFTCLYDVQNMAMTELPSDLDKLQEMMECIQNEVNAQTLKNTLEEKETIDWFIEILSRFQQEANTQTINIRQEMEKWIHSMKDTMHRFGFTGSTIDDDEEEGQKQQETVQTTLTLAFEFFTTIYGFSVAFAKADRENEVKRLREEQRAKQLAQKSISKPTLGPRSMSSMDMLSSIRKEENARPESVEKSPSRHSPMLRQRSASLSAIVSNNHPMIERLASSPRPIQVEKPSPSVESITPVEPPRQVEQPLQVEEQPQVDMEIVPVVIVKAKEQTPETPEEEVLRSKPQAKARVVTPPKKKREGTEGPTTKPPPTPKKKNPKSKGTNNQSKPVLTVPGKIVKTTSTNMKQAQPSIDVLTSTRPVSS